MIALRSGKTWQHFQPRTEDVDIRDIAHSLAMQCRWTGHTREFYSIASHSLHVCDIVTLLGHPEHALAALLHDAAEAYYGDVSTPLKKWLPDYNRALDIGEAVVALAMNLPADMPSVVHRADAMALGDEYRDLMTPIPNWTPPEASGLPVFSEPPGAAKERFLAKYDELKRRERAA